MATGAGKQRGGTGPGLLERDRDLEAIEGALAGARAGDGGAILFEGPAGIGKTSLLAAAAERAGRRGIRVLRASGDDLERDFPWGMAIQLFGGLLAEQGAAAELFDGAAGLARPLLDRGSPQEASADPHPLLHGFHWLTSNLAEREALLLVVDDVHLCDRESLQLINYLLRRIGGMAVSLALAARPREMLDPVLSQLLDRLRADPAVRVRAVRPLEDGSIRALAKASLPGASKEFCDGLVGAVAGNPFLCHELLEAVHQEGVEPTGSGAASVRGLRPAAIRNSILVRLGRLGSDASLLATAVAVLGPAATPPLTAALAALDPDAAAAAADALAAAEMIEVGETLRFVHPIVREVVHDDLPAARLRREHLRAAELLREREAPAEEVASHLLRTDPTAEEWATAALREAAATDLGRGAPARAAQLLRAALRSDGVGSAELLVELGRAEAAAGEPAASERFQEALRLSPAAADGAAIALALAETLYRDSRLPEAAEASERGLDLLAALPVAERDPTVEARLLAALDTPGRLAGHYPARVRARTEALVASPETFSSPADRVLMAMAAGGHAVGGDLPADRVVELVRAALEGSELPAALGAQTLELAVVALIFCDRYSEAVATIDRMIERARARGEAASYVSLPTLRALCTLATGPVPLAIAEAADAVRVASESPGRHRPSLAAARYVLAVGSLLRGEPGEAESALAVSDAEAVWGTSAISGWFLAATGRVALARARHAEALAAFRAAGQRFSAGRGEVGVFCDWRSGAALAARGVEAGDEALELVEEELDLARRFGSQRGVGVALRCRALLSEDAAESVELLREAAATGAESEALVPHAHTLIELGAALRRAGHRRECRRPLREGHDRARRLGARGLAERAAIELKASGARRPRLALTGVESLTPSELRVAEMAAAGMGNREIAESLFVTRKTVEVHLSNAYRKLEIRSREELPSALAAGMPSIERPK